MSEGLWLWLTREDGLVDVPAGAQVGEDYGAHGDSEYSSMQLVDIGLG